MVDLALAERGWRRQLRILFHSPLSTLEGNSIFMYWTLPHQMQFPVFLKIIVCYSQFSKWEHIKHKPRIYFICTIFQSQTLNSLRREHSHYRSRFAQALLVQQLWLCTHTMRCHDFREAATYCIIKLCRYQTQSLVCETQFNLYKHHINLRRYNFLFVASFSSC